MILQRLADGADLSAEPLPGQPIVEIAGELNMSVDELKAVIAGENRSQGEIRSGLRLRL